LDNLINKRIVIEPAKLAAVEKLKVKNPKNFERVYRKIQK